MTPLTAGREREFWFSPPHPLQEYKEGVSVEALQSCHHRILTIGLFVIFKQTFPCSSGISGFSVVSFFSCCHINDFLPLEVSGFSLFRHPHLSRFQPTLTQCQGDGRWLSLFVRTPAGLLKGHHKAHYIYRDARAVLIFHAEHTSSQELALLWALNSQLMFSVSSVSTISSLRPETHASLIALGTDP